MHVEELEKLPEGTTIYTVLRSVARSGMSRAMDAYVMIDNAPVYVSLAHLGLRQHRSEGYVVTGAGMDMGFHVVYRIGQKLHGNGYYFAHRWL